MSETLKLTHPMTFGPGVTRLQELLDAAGVGLNHPNDGIFGPQTEADVREFQKRAGLVVDGIVGPKTWAAIEQHFPDVPGPTPGIVDLRGTHAHPYYYREGEKYDPLGVVVHQTGCIMPTSTSGWLSLNAHIGLTSDGKILIVNPLTDFIWHAQGLSHQAIGIEISGNYRGLKGDDRTYWKPGGGPSTMTPAQLAAIPALFDWLVAEFKRIGRPWQFVYGHRQASDQRTADPGEEIWKEIALPWQIALKATDGGDRHKTGSGAPIPKQWNANYTTDYWTGK